MIRSAQEFIKLSEESDPRATAESADEGVWMEIVRIASGPIKEWVAQNKTVPLSVLNVLARDNDARVRFVVATKRKCDTSLFELLAKDIDETVRHRVAYNPKTPLHILMSLRDDPSPLVSKTAKERLG
jgi:hypothetical protein